MKFFLRVIPDCNLFTLPIFLSLVLLSTNNSALADDSREQALKRGMAAINAGNYAEADTAFQQCLKISEGKDYTAADVAMSLHWLVKINLDQHKWQEAEPLIKRALTIDENELKDMRVAAFDLDALAVDYLSLDRPREALEAMQRKIAIDEKNTQALDPLFAENYLKMGMIYDKAKMLAESETALRKSLEIRDKNGDRSSDLIINLVGLGSVCLEQKKYVDALPFLNRALTIKEKEVGPESADLTKVLTRLQAVYEKTGDQKMADQMRQRLSQIKASAPALPTVPALPNAAVPNADSSSVK